MAKSLIGQLVPLVILFIFLGALGFIGYHIYLSAAKIQETATERMGKKNVVFTKDGVRVGVKEIENEQYVDKTQSWVVKAWNLSGQAIEDKSKRKQKTKAT